MRKFKKIDYFYAIALYFMLFIFVGAMFFAVLDVIAWSISIFLIVYIAYWSIIFIKNLAEYSFIIMELFEEELKKRLDK